MKYKVQIKPKGALWVAEVVNQSGSVVHETKPALNKRRLREDAIRFLESTGVLYEVDDSD